MCWGVSALCFAAAGQRIGSLVVNIIRLVWAFGFLMLVGLVMTGEAIPLSAAPTVWMWMLISGFVGFFLGDMCSFRALVSIGPRLYTVISCLAPGFAALIAYFWLGESLTPGDMIGIGLVFLGIVLALRPRSRRDPTVSAVPLRGILLAVGGAAGQGAGLVISKYGMGDASPAAATQIRVLAGILSFALLHTLLRSWARVFTGIRDRRGHRAALLGAFFGPFVGVTLSLFSVKHTASGVGASLMSLQALFVIPLAMLFRGEQVDRRAWVGAGCAVAGVTALFLL